MTPTRPPPDHGPLSSVRPTEPGEAYTQVDHGWLRRMARETFVWRYQLLQQTSPNVGLTTVPVDPLHG
jgi:hypothetical protein